MNIFYFDEHLSLQSKEIVIMKNYLSDKMFITMIKIHHIEENSSI